MHEHVSLAQRAVNDVWFQAELDDVERRRQKFLALQSRRKEDEEQKRKKLEDNKRRLNEKQRFVCAAGIESLQVPVRFM